MIFIFVSGTDESYKEEKEQKKKQENKKESDFAKATAYVGLKDVST